MSEIHTQPEVADIQKSEIFAYQEIKPESGITPQESKQFWNEKFESLSNSDVHYDDNGTIYRRGDNLEPNAVIEKNGYTFKTDDNGRVISAEGALHIPEKTPRAMDSMEAVGKGDQIEGQDERFHLIGHQFGGSDGIENLVPGDGKLNHGEYLSMETKLADAVKDGCNVKLKVEPVYLDNSYRPVEFRATYTIDGEKTVQVFRNGRENEA